MGKGMGKGKRTKNARRIGAAIASIMGGIKSKPDYYYDDDDDDEFSSSDYSRYRPTPSTTRKRKKDRPKSPKNEDMMDLHLSSSSSSSPSSSSISPTSECKNPPLAPSTNENVRRAGHRVRRGKKKRGRRRAQGGKRRHGAEISSSSSSSSSPPPPPSSSSSSSSSSCLNSRGRRGGRDDAARKDGEGFLTREELFELPSRDLRKRCRRLGLDDGSAVEKEDLVDILHSYYRRVAGGMVSDASRAMNNAHPTMGTGVGGAAGGGGFQHHNHQQYYHQQQQQQEDYYYRSAYMANTAYEAEQMVEGLHEMLHFYGRGNESFDAVVRSAIDHLPTYALEIPDRGGNTLLMLACQSGASALVPAMIARGCNVDASNGDGVTSLMLACYTESYSYETARALVEGGANAEVSEHTYGCTPLHWAAYAGDVDMCRLLCMAGARPTTLDKNGCDSIEYAKKSKSGECVELLSRMAKSAENRALDTGRSTITTVDSHPGDSSVWERNVDEETGLTFYYNTKTGDSLWEEDYEDLQRSKNVGVVSSPLPEETNTNSKHPQEDFGIPPSPSADRKTPSMRNCPGTPLKLEIPPGPLDLSPISGSHTHPNESSANNEAIKDAFEERLGALQSNMERQFLEKLKKIEDKINATPLATSTNEGNTTLARTDGFVGELSSRVVELQAEIGSRDLEIISLKRDVAALKTKIAAAGTSQIIEKESRDVALGDDDLATSSVPSEDARRLLDELDSKKRELADAQQLSTDLQTNLSCAERQLSSLETKHDRTTKQMAEIEERLNAERVAKEDMIALLEQTGKGAEVDAKVCQSLQEENARFAAKVSKLEAELETLGLETEKRIGTMTSRIEDQEKLIEAEAEKSEKLQGEVEELRALYTGEKEKLAKAEDLHALKRQELAKAHAVEMEATKNDLISKHTQEREILQEQVNEERLARMEKEVERNDAMDKMDDYYQRTATAEAKLKEMADVITEAKALVAANERLQRALLVETDRRKALHNQLEDLKGRIRVYVRIRPLNSSEDKKCCQIVLKKEDKRTCVMHRETERSAEVKSWEFDQIFYGTESEGNTQDAVFHDTKMLLTSAVDGFNVCIFAYGQTGSGKTYTMFGAGGIGGEMTSDGTMGEDCGLAPRTAAELFRVLEEKETSCHTEVAVTMLELYNDALRDLLGRKDRGKQDTLRIKLAEHSDSRMVEVDGAVKEKASNSAELLALFKRGAQCRTTSSTHMNADSSRSHLITSIFITVRSKRTGKDMNGKFTLVDLAGSERVSKSGASGHQLKEAQSINKSLSALGDVISALTSGSKHVPYRNHPLTMLMSDSIGGSAKTLMFVCCSPADYNQAESSNSLDFAKRCKDVTNNVHNGPAGQTSQVRALKAELERMKKEKGDTVKRKGGAKRPGMA